MINQPDLLLSHSADRLLLSGDGGLIIDPVGMTKGRQELLKHSLQLSLSLSVYLTLSPPLQVLMNFMEWSRRARTQSVCAALDCRRNAVYFPSDVNSVVCGCSHLYFTPSHQFSSIQPSNRRGFKTNTVISGKKNELPLLISHIGETLICRFSYLLRWSSHSYTVTT